MRMAQKQYEDYKTALDMLTLIYKTGGKLDLGANLINARFRLTISQERALYQLSDFYKEMRGLEGVDR